MIEALVGAQKWKTFYHSCRGMAKNVDWQGFREDRALAYSIIGVVSTIRGSHTHTVDSLTLSARSRGQSRGQHRLGIFRTNLVDLGMILK